MHLIVVMKNERHSNAAKWLNRARKLLEAYCSNLATARYNLLISKIDPYKRCLVRDYEIEIEDCRFMINKLQKETKNGKKKFIMLKKNLVMEVKIQIPDNCELIKDGNTYIVKEKKQTPPRSWKEFCKNYPKTAHEHFIRGDSIIEQIFNSNSPRNIELEKKSLCL